MRPLRALLLILALVAAPWPVSPAAVAAPPDPGDKVSAWVTEHTAGGQSAEFLVVLNQQADLSGAASQPTKQARGRFVFEALLKTAQATQGPLLAWLTANNVPHRAFYITNLVWVQGDASVVQALAARADVARLDANPQIANSLHRVAPAPRRPVAAPEGVESSLTYVNADDVWALGYTGQGIVIGGQDTGYQWDHPALKPHYRGWNGTTVDHNYNWHDSIHSGTSSCGGVNLAAPCDDNNHGTHTMGTAVGDDGGSNQIGMAPGAQWIGCRNMVEGVGTPATYLECFEWFLAPYALGDEPADGNPDLAPDVTINSWGCPPVEGCVVNSLRAAVEAQRAAGIFTVVSAGNKGSACSTIVDPPSFYDAAYTVGALNNGTDVIAGLSSRGPVSADGSGRIKPDIAAPGTSILSSIPNNSYTTMMGTSMAVPHVVGAVALLWSARPAAHGQIGLTEIILNQAAHHINSAACGGSGSWPNPTYGYGRLNVQAAVNSVPAEAGTLTGTVTEALTGEPVPGANLRATFANTPTLTFDMVSDTEGVFTQTLFVGTYTLTVSHPPLWPATVGGITILSNAVTTQNFALGPSYSLHFPLLFKTAP